MQDTEPADAQTFHPFIGRVYEVKCHPYVAISLAAHCDKRMWRTSLVNCNKELCIQPFVYLGT